jgi:DNA polymerase-3 subunit epsilon
MRYSERPLAIVDLETTGLDASIHEILDMAVLIVDQKTLKITDRYSSRIKPRHIKRAARRALEVVGYSPRLWQTAVGLETALHIINEKAKGAILCSTNIYLARSFLDAAFKRCGVEDSTSYHHLDLMSVAWTRSSEWKLPRLTLDALCAYHGIASQPLPRRAREGARTQLAILQALRA